MQVQALKDKALWLFIVMCAMVLDAQYFLEYRFNFTILVVFYLGVKWDISRAFVWAFVIGLVLDSMSMRLIGPNILSKVTVIFLTYFFKTGIFNLASLLSAILCFAFTAIDAVTVYTSLSLFDVRPTQPAIAFNLISFQAITNSIMAYFLFDKED
ncbi:MAG: rod shape-determining protein MreD [Nitrospirae bacterium]|nr:rod shape-determining protein MreD [Nitrospirota bacterium]MBF0591859.1 rod shape-determining protein MreD [Nitrospirota bacterium]